MKIGTHQIGLGKPVFVIAEAGINHNGSMSIAKKMIVASISLLYKTAPIVIGILFPIGIIILLRLNFLNLASTKLIKNKQMAGINFVA